MRLETLKKSLEIPFETGNNFEFATGITQYLRVRTLCFFHHSIPLFFVYRMGLVVCGTKCFLMFKYEIRNIEKIVFEIKFETGNNFEFATGIPQYLRVRTLCFFFHSIPLSFVYRMGLVVFGTICFLMFKYEIRNIEKNVWKSNLKPEITSNLQLV